MLYRLIVNEKGISIYSYISAMIKGIANMRPLLIIFSLFLLVGCRNRSSGSDYNSFNESDYDEDGYRDGIYCAEIDYYYSKTGTSSTYTLTVEIENNDLVRINWSNGGWLDDSHFYPPDISDGYATFESDRGVEYTVEIIGGENDCYTSNYAPSEDTFADEEDDKVCPRCGDSKYDYDEYCDSCIDLLENTCSRCGAFQYYVYQGLCDSCQEDD